MVVLIVANAFAVVAFASLIHLLAAWIPWQRSLAVRGDVPSIGSFFVLFSLSAYSRLWRMLIQRRPDRDAAIEKQRSVVRTRLFRAMVAWGVAYVVSALISL
jgi:hypothetical protein